MADTNVSFARRVLDALADPTGANGELARLRAENEKLRRDVQREKQRADRYCARHDEKAQELSAERAKLMRVATLKCWTNEDGKRFVFVSDLQAALNVPTEE